MTCTAKKQVYQGKNQYSSSVRKFGKSYANIGSKLERSRYALSCGLFLPSFSYITQPTKVEYVTLKKDTCDETSAKMVPDNVLLKVDIIRFFPREFYLSIFSI